MDLKIEIRHLVELTAAFAAAPEAIKKQLKLAMLVAMRDIQSRARSEHRFRSRSGNLERSIETEILSEWPIKGRVSLKPSITMTDSGRSYGKYVHDGTDPHIITPREKKCLRWAGGNGFIFAKRVTHPGTKADPFLYNAGNAERENINNTFERYTLRAIREVGINING